MDVTQKLIKKAKQIGIDTDKTVYTICIGDVLDCIADCYGNNSLNLPENRLKYLIEKGIKGLEWLSWWEPINSALNK